MQLETSVILRANLSLQFGQFGSISSAYGFGVQLPHLLGATMEVLFGVLSRSLRGMLRTLPKPAEAHCQFFSVYGTPNRANIGLRLAMIFVLVVDFRITTSKYLL